MKSKTIQKLEDRLHFIQSDIDQWFNRKGDAGAHRIKKRNNLIKRLKGKK